MPGGMGSSAESGGRIWLLLAWLACASCGRGGGPAAERGARPADAKEGGAGMTAPERRWDFDGETAGALPAGFEVVRGEWALVEDGPAPGAGRALAQRAKSTGSAYNLVLIEGTAYRDVDLSVRVKAISGEEDQGGGLVWRAKDGENYYIARYNPLEANFRVYKVAGGKRSSPLASADVGAAPGWHEVRVTMKGPEIRCFLDGKEWLRAQDSIFPAAGRIGLWSKADARSLFDSLRAAGEP